nr:hypothetical protein [Frankia tisae]
MSPLDEQMNRVQFDPRRDNRPAALGAPLPDEHVKAAPDQSGRDGRYFEHHTA